MRAARVHHAARRRGGCVAAGGAGAAGGAHAAHRRAHESGRGRPGGQARLAAFVQGLQELGWTDGRNLRIDIRWARAANDIRKHAAELVALAPDVILAANGTATVAPLQQATRTVPIVFVNVIDPVGAGFVASLARPGGNATGFMQLRIQHERKMAGAAQGDCAARDAGRRSFAIPTLASGIGQFGAIQAVAPSFGVELSPVDVRDASEIERAVTAFARGAEWRPDRDGERLGSTFIAT